MINHYWQVYKEFVSTSFTQALSFRTSFFLLMFMDLIFYFTTMASVVFIYDHVELIGIWKRDQLLFFISYILALDHIHMTVVSESFWEMGHHIKTGSFDFILLRPLSSIFSVFFRHFRPATVLNGPVAWFFVIYYGSKLNFNAFQWFLIPVFLLLSLTLLLILEFIISVAMFWIVEGLGINFLRMQLQQLSRWPDFIYAAITRRVLTFALPVLLIGSAPVRFLYDTSDYQLLLYMIFAIIIGGLILKKLWAIGLTKYDSASS